MHFRFLFLLFGVTNSFALLSKDLQSIVNTKLMPSDLVKMKAVDPNWKGDGIFERITKIAGLFVHRDTNEIILETKEKLWTESEIIEVYRHDQLCFFSEHSYRLQYRINKFKNFIQTKDWDELFLQSLRTHKFGKHWTKHLQKNWRDALTEIIDVNGYKVLETAVRNDATNVVKMLLEKGADANLKRLGTTALHYAAYEGNIEAIELLLKKAEINATDESKKTPLMLAVQTSKFDPVKMLLEGGARLDFKNTDGNTVLDIAKFNRNHGLQNEKIIKLLETQQNKLLLELKVESNVTDKSEETPMMKAVTYSSFDARLDMKSDEEETALGIVNYKRDHCDIKNETNIGLLETQQNQVVLEKKNKKASCENCVII